MRTEGQRMHWTGPDLPREDDAAWGDSAWRKGTRQLLVRLHAGWASEADDLARDRLVTSLAAENQRLRRLALANGVLTAAIVLLVAVRAWQS